MNRRVTNWALICAELIIGFQLFLAPSIFAQPFLPGAIVTLKAVDRNGWSMGADSFDSSDPTKSTNGLYDPAKYIGDNADLFANLGIVDSVPAGSAHIFGRVHTSPTTNVPSLGSGGAIGSHSWQLASTGIEPGWWLQDWAVAASAVSFPDTTGFLTPTGGVLVTTYTGGYRSTNSYDHILWGSNTYTNYYVANDLSGQTIVIGTNVVLAVPNGLNIAGNDSFFLSSGGDILGRTYTRAAIVVYSGGGTCSIVGNSLLNWYSGDFLLCCCSTVTNCAVAGTSSFKGVVFAPATDVSLIGAGNSSFDFTGSIVANSLLLNGNFNLHYDEALSRTVLPPTRCVPPPAGLITWWSGDGNGNDITGQNNASISGGAGFVPGKVGLAIALNGVDSYVRTNTVATTNMDNWSMTTWVNWQGLVGNTNKTRQTLLYNGNEDSNGYGLIIPEPGICALEPTLCSEVGKLVIAYGGVAYIPTGISLDQNAWDHITLARENGVIKLYQDATLVFSNPTTDPNRPSSSDGYITVGTNPDYAFHGLVDEIMFCNVAVTGDQVAALFSAGGLGACKPLVFDSITQITNGWTTLALSGQTGKAVTIYASRDLLTWSAFATNSNPQGTLIFTDTTSSNELARFYKALAQ
jgi:hypothetical protein